jgi:hypothetical protein
MGCLEAFGRRFTSELLFAALIVASLVEAIVRGIFSPLACLAKCCCLCMEEKNAEACEVQVYGHTLVGSLISLENAVNATSALFSNIFCHAMNYDALAPCFACINSDVDFADPDL